MDEINVRIEPVDEIIVNVLNDDDIEVSIEEVEEIEVRAFDYPPEIDQLNSRVAVCEGNLQNAIGLANAASEMAAESAGLAAEAYEAANGASDLATQASHAAATATETANAAGSFANQAAQAAQEAVEIAEGAAVTAGEAAQSINTHATATTNPHPPNVTQEFADTQITPLAAEATYTPTVWGYLVGLFTTVPKSVKEHIVKGWIVIENLKSRITAIETKIIADVTVSQEVSAVDITGLNIKEGETVAVQFHGEQFIIPPNTSAYMYIRVNGISDALYNNGATAGGIPNYPWFRVTFRERTSLQLFFTLFNGKVLMSGEAMSVTGSTSYAYVISGILLSSITSISSINFSSSGIGSYKAGDNFRVVKL